MSWKQEANSAEDRNVGCRREGEYCVIVVYIFWYTSQFSLEPAVKP